jgi:hypothetical protein
VNRRHRLADERKGSTWSESERDILRALYRTSGAKEASKKLPGRTVIAVYAEADRLGLTSKRDANSAACGEAAVKIGLDGFCSTKSPEADVNASAAAFFAARNVAVRQNAGGIPSVLLVSLAQWLATNPPELDLRRVDQAWFVSKLLRCPAK